MPGRAGTSRTPTTCSARSSSTASCTKGTPPTWPRRWRRRRTNEPGGPRAGPPGSQRHQDRASGSISTTVISGRAKKRTRGALPPSRPIPPLPYIHRAPTRHSDAADPDGRPPDIDALGVAVQLAHAGPSEEIDIAPVPGIPVAAHGEGRRDRGETRHAAPEDRQGVERVDGVARVHHEIGALR